MEVDVRAWCRKNIPNFIDKLRKIRADTKCNLEESFTKLYEQEFSKMEYKIPEIIVRAAILKNDIVHVGLEGDRHHNILINAKGALKGIGFDGRLPVQGFITSRGNFVNREIAAEIAFNAGQIKEEKRELYSEDLW